MLAAWRRGELGDALHGRRPDRRAAVGPFEHFLSARWALVALRRRRLVRGRVDHPRWRLHRLVDVDVRGDLLEAAGLSPPAGEPHAMYSPGVVVEISRFRRIELERR